VFVTALVERLNSFRGDQRSSYLLLTSRLSALLSSRVSKVQPRALRPKLPRL